MFQVSTTHKQACVRRTGGRPHRISHLLYSLIYIKWYVNHFCCGGQNYVPCFFSRVFHRFHAFCTSRASTALQWTNRRANRGMRCNGRTDRPIVLPCNGQMDRPIVPLAMNILRTPHGGGCSLPADTEWSGRFLTAIASKRSPFSYQRMITGECRAYLAPAYSPGHALLHRFLRFRPLSLACRGDTVCNMHSLFLRAVMQRSWVRCVPLKLCAIWQTLIYMLIFLLLLLVVLPLPPC